VIRSVTAGESIDTSILGNFSIYSSILKSLIRILHENTNGIINFSNEHMKINTDKTDGFDFMMYTKFTETTEFPVRKKLVTTGLTLVV
jgi:hypothetical protein